MGVAEAVGLAVRLPLKDADPLLEADAPAEREGVGAALTVPLPLAVDDGVGAGVPEPVPEADGVGVPVPMRLAVALPPSEFVPVLEGDTPAVNEAVGEALAVVLPLSVEEGVADAAPVPVPL